MLGYPVIAIFSHQQDLSQKKSHRVFERKKTGGEVLFYTLGKDLNFTFGGRLLSIFGVTKHVLKPREQFRAGFGPYGKI